MAHGLGLGGFAAFVARRFSRAAPASACAASRAASAEWSRARRPMAAEATRETAPDSLQAAPAPSPTSATARRARRRGLRGPLLAAPPAGDTGQRAASPQASARGAPVRAAGRRRPSRRAATPTERARELWPAPIARARDGRAGASAICAASAAEDRALLAATRDPADHAHRIGMSRPVRGAARPGARAGRAGDRAGHPSATASAWLSPRTPGRIAGRGAPPRRVRQRGEGAAPQRREHLRPSGASAAPAPIWPRGATSAGGLAVAAPRRSAACPLRSARCCSPPHRLRRPLTERRRPLAPADRHTTAAAAPLGPPKPRPERPRRGRPRHAARTSSRLPRYEAGALGTVARAPRGERHARVRRAPARTPATAKGRWTPARRGCAAPVPFPGPDPPRALWAESARRASGRRAALLRAGPPARRWLATGLGE